MRAPEESWRMRRKKELLLWEPCPEIKKNEPIQQEKTRWRVDLGRCLKGQSHFVENK